MEAVTAPAPRAVFLERRFALSERGTNVRIEVLGGVSTFLTMCYILFVDPAILSEAGLPFNAVAVGTAVAAAVTTAAMGLLTNYPFALASGLGLNAVVPAFLVIAGIPLTFSIAAGIGFGVVGFVTVMAALGRWREVHPLMYALVPLFLAFYASDWLSAHVF